MRRLVKYLKPYRGLILLSIVLLFVQAMCDLALPDLMSRIVNYGIQGGGVTEAAPAAIRQSEMNRAAGVPERGGCAARPRRLRARRPRLARVRARSRRTTRRWRHSPSIVRKALSDAETAWLEPVVREGAADHRQPRADAGRPGQGRGGRQGIRASTCPGFRRARTSSRCSASLPAGATHPDHGRD